MMKLLLLLLAIVRVRSFPDRAGDCQPGQPAVGGIHLSYGDGTRHVQSGNFRDSHLRFYVDGAELSVSGTATVSPGVQHNFEVVSSLERRPFQGALIRTELPSSQDDSNFLLLPMINAGDAEACHAPAQGSSHTNSLPKTVLSAGFTAKVAGNYPVDVTVVEMNNSTGSVYWYSRFIVVVQGSTIQSPATLDSECLVCGSIDSEILLPNHEVVLNGVKMTCEEMMLLGRKEQIGNRLCREAQVLADSECFCTRAALHNDPSPPAPIPSSTSPCDVCGSGGTTGAPDAQVFFENDIGTCRELVQHGEKGLISASQCPFAQLIAQKACKCTTARTPSFSPTVSPLPTYTEPCHVCGLNGKVTLNANIELGETIVRCQDLSLDGEEGYIPPELCRDAQEIAAESCGCTRPDTATPTVTFAPTITSFPTFAQSCSVCPEGQSVTKPDHVILVDGGAGTCRELEEEGRAGFVAPTVCPDAQATARGECGCSPTPTPTPSAGTYFPTYRNMCHICGRESSDISLFDSEVVVGGDRGTCRELQQIALSRLLPEEDCAEAQAEAASKCGCSSELNLPPTMEPTVTMYPTYTNACSVCQAGARVTDVSKYVEFDGLKLTCAELEEAGRDHVIPPLFCAEVQSIAQLSCKCKVETPRAPSLLTFSPTITPLPTITSTPTFSEVCEICPQDSFITQGHALLEIDSTLITCHELAEAAQERMIPPSVCPTARAKATEACYCKRPAHVVEAAPSPSFLTFSPTKTALPTITPSPTFLEVCEICPQGSFMTQSSALVEIDSMLITCHELAEAAEEKMIPPSACPMAQAKAAAACNCKKPAVVNSLTPTQSPVWTFQPTITGEPTVTASPTFAARCDICGEGNTVLNRNTIVDVAGIKLTCLDLNNAGSRSLIPPDNCSESRHVAREKCGCRSLVPTPSKFHTFRPTITSEPTITPEPSHAGRCQICPHGRRVSVFDAIVSIEGYLLTCKALEDFASQQKLNFQLCVEAQQRAKEQCGCVLASDVLLVETQSGFRQAATGFGLAVAVFALVLLF